MEEGNEGGTEEERYEAGRKAEAKRRHEAPIQQAHFQSGLFKKPWHGAGAAV